MFSCPCFLAQIGAVLVAESAKRPRRSWHDAFIGNGLSCVRLENSCSQFQAKSLASGKTNKKATALHLKLLRLMQRLIGIARFLLLIALCTHSSSPVHRTAEHNIT